MKRLLLSAMVVTNLLLLAACGSEGTSELSIVDQLSDVGNVWAESADSYFDERIQKLKGAKVTILYDQDHTGQGKARNVKIKEARLGTIEKLGESPCVDAEISLQAWRFSYEAQLDVEDVTAVVRTDGRDEQDSWFGLSGERCLIVEHDTADNWINTLAELSEEELDAWSRDYETMDEALFDWYLRTNGFSSSVPPYLEQWDDTLVHREDGEGWRIYIPVDWQEAMPRESMVQWTAPDGSASIAIQHLAHPADLEKVVDCAAAPDGGVYQVTQNLGEQVDQKLSQKILESFQAGMEYHSWEPAHVLPMEQQGQDLASAIDTALWQALPGSQQSTQWHPIKDDGSGTAYGLVFRQIKLQSALERKLLLPAVIQYQEENGLYTVTEVTLPREDQYEADVRNLFPANVAERLTSEEELHSALQAFHAEHIFWQTDAYTENLATLADAATVSQGESARLLIKELLRRAEETPTEFNQLLYGDNALRPDQKDWVQGLMEHGCPEEILALPDALTIQNLAQLTTATEVRQADGPYMTSAVELVHRSPVNQTSARVDFLAYGGRYTEEQGELRETKGVPQLVTCWIKWNGVGWEPDQYRATDSRDDEYKSHIKDIQKQLPEEDTVGLTEAQIQEKMDSLKAQCRKQAEQMALFEQKCFS